MSYFHSSAGLSRLKPRQSLLPGIALSGLVTLIALLVERGEMWLFGRAWLEALVIAILVGTAMRTAFDPPPAFTRGIAFSAKIFLELAVVLLGASISGQAIATAGPPLMLSIVGLVIGAIAASYAIGRLLGLNRSVALLVACGNSICGNSAIAAVAPVINAKPEEITASITFTAVLGVIVVLLLPTLAGVLGFDARQYGIFAGLTVYAVPQVIAATAPMGTLALQTGTLVKLMRVLMLGPVIFGISLGRRHGGATKPRLEHLLPWFIVGFVVLLGLRSFGLVPQVLLAPIGAVANILTLVSMAALGLSVDIRGIASAGGRVTATATLSLLVLGGLAYAVVSFATVR